MLVVAGTVWIRRQPTTRRIAAVAFMCVVALVTFFVPTPPKPTAMALAALLTYAAFTLFAFFVGRDTRVAATSAVPPASTPRRLRR
ncbi:hypothetical protein BH09MYX1_BH09MYX1_54370 [soil metagenome]